MRRLIAAVRAVVALPARATTTLADWNRDTAQQRILRADIDAAVAKARLIARTDTDPLVQSWAEVLQMPTDVADRDTQTRKEAA